MKHLLNILFIALLSKPVMAEEIITPAKPFTGWFWYNEPKDPHRALKNSSSPRPALFLT